MEFDNNAIEVKALRKAYGKTEVLKGVDLSVKAGSVFCLLGSNGAGKTTLIKILSTLLPLDEGSAVICGNDVKTNASRVRQNISLTGQYAAVDELLTARENLVMTAKLFHIKNPKAKADELLARFDLSDKGDAKVSKYSGGMRRRLDIAMSLTGNPKVIFLDEPSTGLDPQNRIEMWNTVRALAKTGITVFLTTQYLEEAEALAQRIAILHEGKIVIEGTADELKNKFPESRVVLGFDKLEDLIMAKQRLEKFDAKIDELSLTINVDTDGEVKSFANILNTLEGLDIAKIEQQKARLEDVFLKLVTKEPSRIKENVNE